MGKMSLFLVTHNCFFKGECRFVRFENDKLINNGRDICRNKHPHESQDRAYWTCLRSWASTLKASLNATVEAPTVVAPISYRNDAL